MKTAVYPPQTKFVRRGGGGGGGGGGITDSRLHIASLLYIGNWV